MTKTTVHILGKKYNIRGDESEEYIQRVAFHVHSQMKEILDANGGLDSGQTAVLAAMNIADELFKSREEAETLKKEVERLKKSSLPGRR